MRLWIAPLLTALLLAPATPGARATDIYVNPLTGLDNLNGLGPVHGGGKNGPVRTINAALSRLTGGGRVILAPSTVPYTDEVVIDGRRLHPHSDSPLIIEGNGAELFGAAPVDSSDWMPAGKGLYRLMHVSSPAGSLLLAGKSAPFRGMLDDAAAPQLSPGQWGVWKRGFVFQVETGKRIADYSLAVSRRPSGILIHRMEYVVIRNLRIRGYQTDGAQVRGPASDIRFEQCLFADNGGAGLAVRGNGQVEATDCFFENNERAGVIGEGLSRLTLKSCSITGSKEEVFADANSKLERTGEAPKPLPVAADDAPKADADMPEKAEKEDAEETKPKKKRASFDD